MLIRIREKATGWIAWVIVGLISIPFALWGVSSYFEGLTQVNVAEVNGTEIDYDTYQRALSERRRSMSQSLGGSVGSGFFDTPVFRQTVLDGLVTDELLRSDIQRKQFRIGDEQLSAYIQAIPTFQEDGRFSAERYDAVLRASGYTPSGFEQVQRNQLVREQWQRGFVDTAFVTAETLDDALQVMEQRRDADYAVVTSERFIDAIEVNDAEIAAQYESHPDRYQSPTRMRVAYLELSVDELSESVEPPEADLRAVYEENKAHYGAPEERRASHILITVAADATEAEQQAALEQAQELLALVEEGADFAELAREHSGDAGSAGTGGDLGVIAPGVMVKPFEDAVLELEQGQVSEPVRTRYGYHLIKLTALKAGELRPFEELRDEIAEQEQRRRAEDQFVELAESFRNLVYEHPEDLEFAADELGMEVLESDWFTERAGTGIAGNPAVRAAAFSDDVLVRDLNSEIVEVNVDRLVAVRRLDHEQSRLRSLDEVREGIEQNLLRDKTAERAREFGAELVERLQAGDEWDAVLEQAGLSSAALPPLLREAEDPQARQAADLVFRAPIPAPGSVAFGGGDIRPDGFTVFRLKAASKGIPDEVDDARRAQIDAALRSRWGEGAYLAYLADLRENADITTYPDVLSGEETY